MNILVTGGAGFIGSHLVDALVKSNHFVIVIDNLKRGKLENIQRHIDDGKVKFIEIDINDYGLLLEVLEEVDLVFHLAAQSNVVGSVDNPEYTIKTNINGTFNMLMASSQKGIKKFVFLSSREVYGDQKYLPVKEDSKLNPKNMYGVSKASGEMLCNIYGSDKLPIAVFRLGNVYGTRDYDRVIPNFINNIKNDLALTVYGGDQVLDFIHISDLIKVLMDTLDKTDYDNGVTNIGSGKGTSIKELALLFKEILGKEIKIDFLDKRDFEVENFIADISKVGFKPIELKEGLRKLFQEEKLQ